MVGLVLAAGRGSRLGKYTDDIPKSLLPLSHNGDSLLDYNLKILQNIPVQKTIVITGYESEKIEEATKLYNNIQILYNPFWNYCNVLGSMYMALDKINDDFLFLHADTLMEVAAWDDLVNFNSGDIVLPFDKKECGLEEMKLIIERDKVISISKEIKPKLASGEFVGIARFNKSTIPFIKSTADRLFKTGELNQYMESVLQEIINVNEFDIRPLNISKYDFVEVDFEEDYECAKTLFGR